MKTVETDKENAFSSRVGEQERRKLRASRSGRRSIWFGLGMFGLVGWSVAVPTLLGTAFGMWLDKRYPMGISWTLTWLVFGLFSGCFIAWHWIAKEHRDMRADDREE
jgi:ATP synthase protein I